MRRDYLGMLTNLAPPGPAWTVDVRRSARGRVSGNNWALLLDAVGKSLQRLDDRCDALIREANPRTARQMLPGRYDEASLPFGCLDRATNPDQMRAEVLYAWAAMGGATPAYFVYLLSKLDIPFRIREFRRPRADEMRVEETPLYGDEWCHWWQVTAVDQSYRHFKTGNSTAGEPLQEWGVNAIVCLINTLKPAHTRVLFRFVVDETELDFNGDDYGVEGLLYDNYGNLLLHEDYTPMYWKV
jgi:uncharacterized protein YmfQ (DUF2313 family)